MDRLRDAFEGRFLIERQVGAGGMSLVYLALFGSVLAFWAYVTLIGQIGADRASYSSLVFPVVALLISTALEGYTWSWPAFLGLCLVLLGNWVVMRRPAP